MRPVIRYRSQLLYRKSYRPKRNNASRLAPKLNITFRPSRVGAKFTPYYECKSD